MDLMNNIEFCMILKDDFLHSNKHEINDSKPMAANDEMVAHCAN